MNRFARNMLARASGGSVALSRVWPGRADRLIIAPHDLRTADATRAAEIYAGRFVFAGKIVNCHGRSIFDLEPPSEDWEVALLGFGWLRHLRAADTALTRANARSLIEDWIGNPASKRRPVARRADVLARRVISLLSQAPLVLNDTDNKFYRRYLRALAREIRLLRYTMVNIPDGVPKLQVLIALCYAALCLANQASHIRSTSKKLSDELQRQILPDGGHVSRNPGALIELLIDLLPLRQTFAARNIAPPPALLNAIDRMMPMLRFFRHGDGNFALFNGMSATPSDLLATLLAYDDTHGAPMSNMPHTGFQRLDAGQTTLIIDTGPPPAAGVSHDAHAGCLSFELSSGISRIVTNCGMPTTGRDNWRPFARGTAAHSTLTYHDTSSCQFVEMSAMKRLLHGAPVTSGPVEVESYREIVQNGTLLTTSHDGYLTKFGAIHRRVLMIANDGARIDGEDTLSPPQGGRFKGPDADFALRFHLHPAVKASRLSDARGVMLVLPNRDVWTFEALDDKVELEDSVSLAGNDGPRRTAQIVIRQDARQAPSIRWSFVRSTASPAITNARRNARREPELPL
ncbi:heparinase II/III family protein [Bradyrhizobium sp. 44]|nr:MULTISPECIES: heparinase II/III family protein [unclassified Bradyrhizobium]MCK1284075.1 heparinase II/III family protein [Bradyrhizobium sp. 44]MCK1298639.1 heparinase II/III family protein [Bradyrhizobium sp. 37]MCK1397695.1 heparinase II/III family protein [Bradyrhizobium sp. 39]MCK1749631.1 heparinase II/III family protein [Bradyrhizobium sp. 135]MCK1769683.1 heparinase II/III family protein [Bradyrhizobium sp. 134]